MLDKMLTEENDSSLTGFFILFENASIASQGIRYALHIFYIYAQVFSSKYVGLKSIGRYISFYYIIKLP